MPSRIEQAGHGSDSRYAGDGGGFLWCTDALAKPVASFGRSKTPSNRGTSGAAEMLPFRLTKRLFAFHGGIKSTALTLPVRRRRKPSGNVLIPV